MSHQCLADLSLLQWVYCTFIWKKEKSLYILEKIILVRKCKEGGRREK
jgi:hypothetical protein